MAETGKTKRMVRTTEYLIGKGDRGKSLVVIRGALSLGSKNKFAGTKIKDSKGASAGFLHRIGKETEGQTKGSIWTVSDAEIAKVTAAAKAANKDVHEKKYTDSVKKLIDSAYDNLTSKGGGGGSKTTPLVW